mgnify:CR=1 FL=1
MIIKNNCRTGLRSLGMTETTRRNILTRPGFVGPLEVLERVGTTDSTDESFPSLSVTKCPRATGHGGGYTYYAPPFDQMFNYQGAGRSATFFWGSENRQNCDRPWRGEPYVCPRPAEGAS